MFSSYAGEWRDLLQSFDAETRAALAALAVRHQLELAQHFYKGIQANETVANLLSNDKVRTQLLGSMQRWIVQVLATDDAQDFDALVKSQVTIGEIHVRLDVPVHLVLRGARCLKDGVYGCLAASPLHVQAQVMHMAASLIDQAMEVMSQGYVLSKDGASRAEEGYRLLTATQNISGTREQCRADLLEWENQFLYLHTMTGGSAHWTRLASSNFGLWFRHKGMDVFKNQPAIPLIEAAMQRIDDVHLPALAQALGRGQESVFFAQLREQVHQIGQHIEALFAHSEVAEAGRDTLTQLFNRKFLPVVLAKEVQYARKTGSSFSALMLEVDDFQRLHEAYGRACSDALIQQVAQLLGGNIHGGDYLFRLSEAEFCMVLVDTLQGSAMQLAEKVRVQVAREVFATGQGAHKLTLSVGVAAFDEHPDYQRILKCSEEALRQAKAQGGNRVVLQA